MKATFRRALAVCLALCMALALGVGAAAASPYSVQVQNNTLSFVQNGAVTGSFSMANNNLTLMVDSTGALLVCFYNPQGTYVGVTLGSQRDLSLSGTVGVLTLNSSYGGTLSSWALTNQLVIRGGATANLYNGVGILEIPGNGTANVQVGTIVNAAYLSSSAARVNVVSGGQVTRAHAVSRNCLAGSGLVQSLSIDSGVYGGSGSGSTSGGSGSLRLTASTIYADYGDRLSQLESALRSRVKAYDRATGKSVPGTVSWVDSRSAAVTRTGDYAFYFDPTSSRYSTVRGTIRIVVEDDGGDLRLETSTIYADDGDRLRDLEDQLEDNVRAYHNGSRVYGEVEWVSSRNTTVSRTRSYDFRFIPNSSRYDTVRGSIRVVVDDDDSDYDYYLEIDDIEVDGDDYTLRDLRSDLRRAVKAYDDDTDRRVSGSLEWRESDSTRVRESGYYEFVFDPSSSRYDSTRDDIYIRVN